MPRSDTIRAIAHDAPNLDYAAKTLEFENLDARETLSMDARDALFGKTAPDKQWRTTPKEVTKIITCETCGQTLIVYKDDEDEPTLEELVCDIANSDDIDMVSLENDGAPVNLGNDYAEYQICVLFDDTKRRVGIGPKELWALLAYDRVEIHAYQD